MQDYRSYVESQVQRNKSFAYFVDFLNDLQQCIFRAIDQKKQTGSRQRHPAEYQQPECLGKPGQALMHTTVRNLELQEAAQVLRSESPLAA